METDHNEPPGETAPAQAVATFDTIPAPRVVVGDRGAGWIVEGWDLFKQAKASWLLLALVGVIWLELLDSFRLLAFFDSLFSFVLSAGLLLACQANYRQHPFNPAILLAGFRREYLGRLLGANLVLIGLSLLIAGVGLGDLLWRVAGDESLQNLLRRMAAQSDVTDPVFMNTLLEIDAAFGLMGLLFRTLVILLLVIPLLAAAWFAPALIVLGNCDVKTALWYSMKAATHNVLSFLIYGVLLLILALLALLPWHLGYLLLIPVFQLSVYLSYRDIFVN